MKLKVYHGIENHIFIEKVFFIPINTSLINGWYNERKCYC